jgi:hypothetical protein
MRIARGLMAFTLCSLSLVTPVDAQGPARKLGLAQILSRVADQAEAFRKIAPTFLAEETLAQKTRKQEKGDYETHAVVSEYAYGGLPGAPAAIHEIRKVISVDGKEVTSLAKARQAMTVGLQSSDDKTKKKLLEDFEKHGLRGAVTDFGQVILLFSARHQKDYEFEQAGEKVVGTDRALILKYKQVGGKGGVMVFRGNGAEKQALQGELVVRETDGLPLQVTMTAVQSSESGDMQDTLLVDYTDSGLGCVVPASVLHQEYLKDELVAQNSFRYGRFRRVEASPK